MKLATGKLDTVRDTLTKDPQTGLDVRRFMGDDFQTTQGVLLDGSGVVQAEVCAMLLRHAHARVELVESAHEEWNAGVEEWLGDDGSRSAHFLFLTLDVEGCRVKFGYIPGGSATFDRVPDTVSALLDSHKARS